ncbi:hypothetical protein ES703_119938 [subsurface metagenome]
MAERGNIVTDNQFFSVVSSYGIYEETSGYDNFIVNNVSRGCTWQHRLVTTRDAETIDSRQHSDLFMDVLAEVANHVGSWVGTGAEQTINPGDPGWGAQPDCPRNLTISAAGGAPTGNIVVTGVDAKGNNIFPTTETIAITPGGTTVGDVAFATITQIVIPATVLAATTISVGIGSKLGLSNIIYRTGDVYKCTKNGADYSGAANITPNSTYNTVDVSTGGAIVNGDDFTIHYRHNLNMEV